MASFHPFVTRPFGLKGYQAVVPCVNLRLTGYMVASSGTCTVALVSYQR